MSGNPTQNKNKAALNHERRSLLYRIENLLELPMVILGFVWLVLLLIELLSQLSPFLEWLNFIIWGIFILDFLLKFFLAPDKSHFLRHNILTIISLAVPALRVFRLTRVFRIMGTVRAARGVRLVKVLGSINRGMRSFTASLGRRGFGYVLGITIMVLFVGAAGMYTLENQENNGFNTYGQSLWWTAMLLTSLGSEYWPRTPEGRTLCFLLGLYGFTVFGYFTATLATFFMGRDAENEKAELAGSQQIAALQKDIKLLQADITLLLQKQNQAFPVNNSAGKIDNPDSRETLN